jgi:type IV secretion system protein VirD4
VRDVRDWIRRFHNPDIGNTWYGSATWATDAEIGTLPNEAGLWLGIKENGNPAIYSGDLHHCCVAGTGGGKFQSVLGPLLADHEPWPTGSSVIIDPKGEALNNCARHLIAPFNGTRNSQVFWLDPWDEAGTGETWSLNLLATLNDTNPSVVDDARVLADAIIVRASQSGEAKYWDDTANSLLTAIILHVALHDVEKDQRHLVRVRELLGLTWESKNEREETFISLLNFMATSSTAFGVVAREARSFLGRNDKEQKGTLATIQSNTSWIDSPQMHQVLKDTRPIDVEDVALNFRHVFVTIPFNYIVTHRQWLRLCVAAFGRAFARWKRSDGDGYSGRRHIWIDEFPSLGHMSFVEIGVQVARGYQIQYHLFTQTFSSLRAVYGENWETFIGNCVVQAFNVRDIFTARYISDKCGVATFDVTARTESESEGPDGAVPTKTTAVSFVQRPLLFPDEVMALPDEVQLIFNATKRPIYCGKRVFRLEPGYDRMMDFQLKDFLATRGRAPASRAEKNKFEWWSKD